MNLTVLKSKTSVHRNLLWNIFGMKSTGQNKSLLLSSPHPPKNSSLDYHSWMRMPLWKSRSTAEKFQHATGGKKIKTKTKTEIGHLKRVWESSFPSSTSSLPYGSTIQCQERSFQSMTSPTGESECVWVWTTFSVWEATKESTSYLSIIPEVCCMTGGRESLRE